MKTFDVRSVSFNISSSRAHAYIADPTNLPEWTTAFAAADDRTAKLVTPAGTVDIVLQTVSHAEAGTVDWIMTFPDGSVGTAYSRVTPDGEAKANYVFVLMAPPVPLEAIEGALETQSHTLAEELLRLKSRLEAL